MGEVSLQWGQTNGANDMTDGDETTQRAKWSKIRDAIIPEPDSAEDVSYATKESLREKFKSSGLQVIIKMATIELTPEKPEFSSGSWHVSSPKTRKTEMIKLSTKW